MAHRTAFPLGSEVTLADLEVDPHPTLARLRAAEPVSWVPALDGWLVTSYELAVQVLRDTVTFTVDDPRFSTAQLVGPSMLSLDGEEHSRHRAPFVAPFRPAAVRQHFTQTVARQTDRLIDALSPSGRAELRRAFAGPLAASIITSALGLEGSEVGPVLGWYDAIVAAVTDITAGRAAGIARGKEAFGALRFRLEGALDAPARPSVLTAAARTSELTAAAHRSALSRQELIANAAVLLFGGIETTEGMITNAVLHLLEHPQQLALVRGHPGRLEVALEESLRLEPAAAVLDRYAAADVGLGEASIRQGDLVRVSIAGANRDPAVFQDPDRLDVGRPRHESRRHVAFAHGPHVCLGVHLARLEGRMALAKLLARLPGLRLDPDHPSVVRGLVFRKPPELYVVWS